MNDETSTRETLIESPKPIQAANCDCIEEINKPLKYGFVLPKMLSGYRDIDGFFEQLNIHVMKNDRVQKRHLKANFCPWCGVKYKTSTEIRTLVETQSS